jgi:hypothetical protein
MERGYAYKILVGKPEGKRPPDTRMYSKEQGYGDADWIHLVHDMIQR